MNYTQRIEDLRTLCRELGCEGGWEVALGVLEEAALEADDPIVKYQAAARLAVALRFYEKSLLGSPASVALRGARRGEEPRLPNRH